jgi:G:T/U-mismatch repair DNA glycosylase
MLRLPSSSPAHATIPYAAKLEIWRNIHDCLHEDGECGRLR